MTSASDSLAAGLAEIRETLTQLHERRSSWERDVAALFDDFDNMAVQLAMETAVRQATAPQTSTTSISDDGWLELAGQQEILAQRQESTTLELVTMRELIEQQSELLTAWIGAAMQTQA